MATVQIQIPDALVPRLRAAMHDAFPETVSEGDAAAFKRLTGDYWKGVLVAYEGRVAEQQAITAMSQAVTAAREQAAADCAAIN